MRRCKWIPVIALLFAFSCGQAADKDIVTSQLSVAKADPGHVVSLDLSNQGLTAFPEEILQMKHLESLDLSGNLLTQIPGDLSHLRELRVIVLSANQLKTFPEGLQTLPRVEVIELNRNRIAAVRIAPGKLSHLKTLELEGNPLLQFPEGLLQLRRIERIDLGGTLVCDPPAPGTLKQLASLTHLFLSPVTPTEKRMEMHAAGYDTLIVLKYLSMAYQHAFTEKITVYDSGIFGNGQMSDSVKRSVRYLDLSNSGLTEIPDELREYTHLEYLDLSGNRIRELGNVLGALNRLKSVDLSRNALTVLDADRLPGKLRYLDAGSNRIEKATGNTARLTAIEYLLLAGNDLQALEGWNLPDLKYADLSANPIGKFPEWLKRTLPLDVLVLPSSLQPFAEKNTHASGWVMLYRDARCGTPDAQNGSGQ